MLPHVVLTSSEVFQLIVGSILGTAVSCNLNRFGLSLLDPETRYKAIAVVVIFLVSFTVLSGLLLR